MTSEKQIEEYETLLAACEKFDDGHGLVSGSRAFSRVIVPLLFAELRKTSALAEKYKWQVRDTCTRAERAENRIAELEALDIARAAGVASS